MGLAERMMAMVLMMGEDERVLEVDDDGGVSGVAVEDVAGRNALRAPGGMKGLGREINGWVMRGNERKKKKKKQKNR